MRKLLARIAASAAPDGDLLPSSSNKLPILHRSLLPVLSFAASIYGLSLSLRRRLYLWGLFRQQRLPVPVISVGNLTWGGNGKTPMTEFLARFFVEAGIPPLVLTRGYAGGDEAEMLCRHLLGTPARIGVGANRAAVAAHFLERYGYIERSRMLTQELSSPEKTGTLSTEDKIGVAILDDGMQHWSLLRDLDIVMVNGMMPWGNNHLLPHGTLREPLNALKRADIAVIHHADLVSERQLKVIESTMRNVKEALPIFFSRLTPSCLFEVQTQKTELPLSSIQNMVVLCVSAIGFPNAFIRQIEKIGPVHVDRLDFVDHHSLQSEDVGLIKMRLRKLEDEFRTEAIIVVTEKDYDRNPVILKELNDFKVLVLCSSLEIMTFVGQTEDYFKELLRKLLHCKKNC